MEMQSKKRALDKIYKRRDRYEIADWQRDQVWDAAKKQQLIDSILRGWKLPKFYFFRSSDEPEGFEVVDGQQRLVTIFEFFDNDLQLSLASVKEFGLKGRQYKDLPSGLSDAFDDFEIEYDEITEASEKELKEFFQRLQQGLSLTSSEKLNAVHSALRNFCRTLAAHEFFSTRVSFANKRYAHFDVASKSAAIEIEGLDAGLRFDELKELFENQSSFSAKSNAAKRLRATLDFLLKAFPTKTPELRNRSLVQSTITLASRIFGTGEADGHELEFGGFVRKFVAELAKQVELGLDATDAAYIDFQRSVNANVREGAKIRHRILMRKMLRSHPSLASIFEPDEVAEAGLSSDIRATAESLENLIEAANSAYSAKHGRDLFKATNKTVTALRKIQKPIKSYGAYKELLSDLYFLFWESTGERLGASTPQSFKDVNSLRTDLQHDIDHGKGGKVKAKRKAISAAFQKYGSTTTPRTLAPEQFVVVQANLMSALDTDMKSVIAAI
ncbi:MAG TPA: DUF262 domain-containing protein [Rhizomicrobium sp.]|jgi:hypothetical protein